MSFMRQSFLEPKPNPLYQFFIFNSKFAGKTEDTEYKKILYFYPPFTSLDNQQKKVGFSEAIIKFTS